ncbi:MAG: CBS domain-containing protein [Thermoplasmata archaeon]|nr:CBS domain-containing protein [Thermoplasmata archaeon]
MGFYGFTVRDVMSRKVVSTVPTATLAEAAAAMSRRRVSGLPVLAEGGRPVGVLSQKDIIRVLHEKAGLSLPGGVFDLLLDVAAAGDSGLLDRCRAVLERAPVRSAMSRPVQSVSPTTTIDEAIQRMTAGKINRLPVVDGGRVIGIVTRTDLLTGIPPE